MNIKKNGRINKITWELVKHFHNSGFLHSSRYEAEENLLSQRSTTWLYSSPFTYHHEKITLLAILETLAVSIFSIWVVVEYNFFLHIAIGIFVSPLFLMRTKKSIDKSLEFGENSVRAIRKLFIWLFATLSMSETAIKLFFYPFAPLILAILAVLSRVIGFAYGVVSDPIESIKAIPKNWKKQVFMLDMAYPPEPIPEIEAATYKGELFEFRYSNLDYKEKLTNLDFFVFLTLLAIFYLPAWIYRLSIKSAAIIYSPMVWVIKKTYPETLNVKNQLRDIAESELTYVALIYSAFVFLAFFLKIYILNFSDNVEQFYYSIGAKNLMSIIVPLEIPRWQMAMLINSILTFSLYLFSKQILRNIEYAGNCVNNCVENCIINCPRNWGNVPLKKETEVTLRSLIFAKTSITIYVFMSSWYIMYQTINNLHWPAIGVNWFPWQ